MSENLPSSPARTDVVAAALALFAERGFEATSVDQIAQSAGISRSTFFRQFGGKDDVIFADHEVLLTQLREFLDSPHENPWLAVCDACLHVFENFAAAPELARRRYAVVRGVPSLRDREITTVFRYERLFDEYLRRALPGLDPLDSVSFAAAVTAVHNHVLRRLLRGEDASATALRGALATTRERFGVEESAALPRDVVVAVFPRSIPKAELARQLRAKLDD
ncbi:AcrR family transcriptional regulator [Microbacterium endophyticum]|uniref:AcrR family transcriptional regulator n=1 Tax=Microbacterium endophyticum TaxID=1526412 RepID=A0A7W4YNF9_9MICO|nr:TetR family transcriptional regulator [Microbacterium endophyticum]MBB2975641.1 AcrR family transcriptional regulator [Microbacterium endophyticum]NIK35340.1 AcrR family transcriptional regulator [Microbacterium endophyticum]